MRNLILKHLREATCKMTRPTAKGKSWGATCTVDGKERKLNGGQKGVKVGKNNPKSEKTFDKRHGKPTSAKQYINKLRWDDKAKLGDTVRVPDNLF